MSIRHQVRLYSTAGKLQAVFDSWRSAQVQRKLNTFSECVFEIDKHIDNRWQLFTTDSFIEVLRSDMQYNLPWTREFLGFHRTPKHSLTEAGNETFTSYARSLEDLTSRRSVAYQTGTGETPVNPSLPNNGIFTGYTYKLGHADDVLKDYVRQNMTIDANNLVRLRPGFMPGFLVGASLSQAKVWEGDQSYKVIREVATSLAEASQFDWSVDLVTLDPPTFIFNTHYPDLGTDRTITNPPVILSPDYQNVKTLDYTVSRTDEVNVAIVLGQVDGFVPNPDPNKPGSLIGQRSIYSTSTAEALESPWNDIELIRDERSAKSEQALITASNEIFATLGPRESFIVTPLVGSNFQYGRDYFFGDRILVKYGDVTRVKKVVGVTIVSGGGTDGEQLTIELADLSPQATVQDVFRNLSNRISTIEHKGDL